MDLMREKEAEGLPFFLLLHPGHGDATLAKRGRCLWSFMCPTLHPPSTANNGTTNWAHSRGHFRPRHSLDFCWSCLFRAHYIQTTESAFVHCHGPFINIDRKERVEQDKRNNMSIVVFMYVGGEGCNLTFDILKSSFAALFNEVKFVVGRVLQKSNK